jgi:hypothetical protein
MDNDLQAIKDAWEGRPAVGQASSTEPDVRDKDTSVYELADKYVAAHPEDFKGFDALGMEVIVTALEKARETGDEASEWKFQTWLFHQFEPQNIGGTHTATVRVHNGQ